MASLGHIALGLAGARAAARPGEARERLWLRAFYLSALSMLPDADVVGFSFGIPYESAFGHRGASHSFAFALLIGALAALLAPRLDRKRWALGLAVAALVASHPILDSATDGGMGCALLWPFSDERFFWPWRPIPVAPIGRRFFSSWGLSVALVELAYFSPLFVYALWPRRAARATSPST